MLPGVGANHQQTYLSESAAVRHANVLPPLTTSAVTDENGSFMPFHRNMSDGAALSEKNLQSSTEIVMMPTIKEKMSHLDVNFDVTDSLRSVSSIGSSNCSSPTSGNFEEEMKVIDQLKETLDLYQQAKQKNHDLKQKLKKMERKLKHLKVDEKKMNKLSKELKMTQEVLKLTQEEVSERTQQCGKLMEDIAHKEIQIQSLEGQLLSAQNECKRLNDFFDKMSGQAMDTWKSLVTYKQKYEQITAAEKDDNYYTKYCDAVKENQQLRDQLAEYEEKIVLLEAQVEFLLEASPVTDPEDSTHGQGVIESPDSNSGPD